MEGGGGLLVIPIFFTIKEETKFEIFDSKF